MFKFKKKLSFKQSMMFTFIALSVLVSFLHVIIHYYFESKQLREVFLDKAREELSFRKKELSLLLHRDIASLLSFSQDSHVLNLIEYANNHYKIIKHSHSTGHSRGNKEHYHSEYSNKDLTMDTLEEYLLLMFKSNSDYTHIRYIANDGYAIFRIDRMNDNSIVVKRKGLQNAAYRYYYGEGMQIEEGGIAFTKIDLNIEHGKIEVPIKPVVRVSVPIFIDGIREGFIIANIAIEEYLDIIVDSSYFDIDLIDGEGEFIIEASKNYSWSRYLSKDYNIFDKYSFLEQVFLKKDEYVSDNLYSGIMDFPNKDNLRLVLKLKDDIWEEEKSAVLGSAFYTFIMIILISIPFASFLSRTPEGLMKKLKKKSKLLLKEKLQMEEQKELFETVLESSLAGIFLYRGKILYTNPSLRQMLGFNKMELYSMTYWDLASDLKVREKIRHSTIKRIKGKDFSSSIEELVLKTKSGESRHFYIGTRTVKINNKLMGFSTLIDITDMKRLHEEVKTLARTDSLTKALNRISFDEVLTKETRRSVRYKKPLSLVIIDIDHFKLVNDTYGHLAGDRILKNTVSLIRKYIRSSDYLIRWGGEEFFILLPETVLIGAFTVAENIRKQVALHEFYEVGKLTVSGGVTEFSFDDSEDSFVKRADDALYSAKSGGRNKVILSTVDGPAETDTVKVNDQIDVRKLRRQKLKYSS